MDSGKRQIYQTDSEWELNIEKKYYICFLMLIVIIKKYFFYYSLKRHQKVTIKMYCPSISMSALEMSAFLKIEMNEKNSDLIIIIFFFFF